MQTIILRLIKYFIAALLSSQCNESASASTKYGSVCGGVFKFIENGETLQFWKGSHMPYRNAINWSTSRTTDVVVEKKKHSEQTLWSAYPVRLEYLIITSDFI